MQIQFTALRFTIALLLFIVLSGCSNQVEDDINGDLGLQGTVVTEVRETPTLDESSEEPAPGHNSSSKGTESQTKKKENPERNLEILIKPGVDRLHQNGPTAAQIERVRARQKKKRTRRKSLGNNTPIMFEN